MLDRSVHGGRRAETERLVPTERPIAIYEYYQREATARLGHRVSAFLYELTRVSE